MFLRHSRPLCYSPFVSNGCGCAPAFRCPERAHAGLGLGRPRGVSSLPEYFRVVTPTKRLAVGSFGTCSSVCGMAQSPADIMAGLTADFRRVEGTRLNVGSSRQRTVLHSSQVRYHDQRDFSLRERLNSHCAMRPIPLRRSNNSPWVSVPPVLIGSQAKPSAGDFRSRLSGCSRQDASLVQNLFGNGR
jgi:hypothetical protein